MALQKVQLEDQVKGTLPVANGGTDASTLTQYAVLLGAGTGAVQFATIGTGGRLLIDQGAGANPAFTAMSGDVTISAAGVTAIGANAATWEKVAHKLRSGQMPPFGRPRPDKATVDAFVATLERDLDEAAMRAPNPGRPVTHRLTRTEYANAVRDPWRPRHERMPRVGVPTAVSRLGRAVLRPATVACVRPRWALHAVRAPRLIRRRCARLPPNAEVRRLSHPR